MMLVWLSRASKDRDEEVLGLREQLANLRVQHRSVRAERDALEADLEASKRSQVMMGQPLRVLHAPRCLMPDWCCGHSMTHIMITSSTADADQCHEEG